MNCLKQGPLVGILLLIFVTTVRAQSCTPDVSEEICKYSNLFFASIGFMRNAPQVVITGPDFFKQKGDVLESQYTWKDVQTNLKIKGSSRAPFSYELGDNIFLIFGDEPCPTSVYISTDQFRRLKKLVYKEDGKTVDPQKTQYTEGIEIWKVSESAALIRGYILGCRTGIVNAPCWDSR